MAEGFEFIRHLPTGTVHVAVADDERAAWWERAYRARPLYRELYPPDVATLLMFNPVPCRCGYLAIRPADSLTDRSAWTSVFVDTDLCRACWRTVPEDDQPRLFEHAEVEPAELCD